MCGIFGFVNKNQLEFSKDTLEKTIKLLFNLSERRGREASGLAIVSSDIKIYKKAKQSSKMVKGKEFKEFLDSVLLALKDKNNLESFLPLAAVGHTRLVTNGTEVLQENNQPIIAGDIVGVHNGIITNSDSLAKNYFNDKIRSGSDSEILLGLIDKYYNDAKDIPKAVSKAFEEIEGSASIAFFRSDLSLLVLATNTGSLYYYYDEKKGIFVFVSEKFIMQKFLDESDLFTEYDQSRIKKLEPFTTAIVKYNDVVPELFSTDSLSKSFEQSYFVKKTPIYKIINASSPKKTLKLCTKCILPETYPFIEFDERGVCNYCHKYEKQEFLGYDALEKTLKQYRSKDGSPDCLMGFSGGRDSSYALHLLKKELKMNPIVYTYDWAMVTDQSRRNQAKVIGKLGIEQIIRAADIHKKRRYIRKNIYAWLKRPKLGMVPIFMAGDKWFYYFGRQLRKETGIKLTIFAAGQQLEQMEFKVGFCGVDQHLKDNTKLYHFEMMKKMQLASWYVKEYILNPRYINESLFDSIFSFYASFLNQDDYVYLYRYIPWDEKLIEKTLKEEYGWEADEKYGKNQWRMGDGYTAFIDYIYYTLSGFSEFDNFRSNQIREGLLTREEALKLAEEDNKPRMEMLENFSQLIGFNLEEVLLKIDSIPKLY